MSKKYNITNLKEVTEKFKECMTTVMKSNYSFMMGEYNKKKSKYNEIFEQVSMNYRKEMERLLDEDNNRECVKQENSKLIPLNEKGKDICNKMQQLIEQPNPELMSAKEDVDVYSDVVKLNPEYDIDWYSLIENLENIEDMDREDIEEEFLGEIDKVIKEEKVFDKKKFRQLADLYFNGVCDDYLGIYESKCKEIFE